MRTILDSLKKTEKYTPQSIPVYVLYYTAWVDQQGRVVYGTDIYKQDKRLIEKLANLDGFAIPGHTIDRVAISGRAQVALVQQ